jgi:hypothetical protein
MASSTVRDQSLGMDLRIVVTRLTALLDFAMLEVYR